MAFPVVVRPVIIRLVIIFLVLPLVALHVVTRFIVVLVIAPSSLILHHLDVIDDAISFVLVVVVIVIVFISAERDVMIASELLTFVDRAIVARAVVALRLISLLV